MIYIAYKKIFKYQSGYRNVRYTIDSHYDKITQEMLDELTPKILIRITIKDVYKLRWIEVCCYDTEPYDAIAIFNDSIKYQIDYNENLEHAISEYKKMMMRDERINHLLN